MKLYIRNMVCNRCVAAVEKALLDNGLQPVSILLGEAEIAENEIGTKKKKFISDLNTLGFEWIDHKNERLVEGVKSLIINLIQDKENSLETNLSDYLSKHLHYEYSTISSLFSELKGTTIEQYYIAQKIEKVKEWLRYEEWSLSEIADRLNYSSVAHLSAQFKKVTGMTPTVFRQMKSSNRKPLDEI